MAGRGPAPKDPDERRTAHAPTRGEWQATPGVGWQHGEIPPCPARGVVAGGVWTTWMQSWFAAYWMPEDLPNLRLIIKLWARADSGKATGSERSELRQLMDSYGITRKGQQDRRWSAPEIPNDTTAPGAPESRYAHLQVVGE